jgi:coproporphyrinogen III oxidase
MEMKQRARELFTALQDRICERLAELDGKASFREDRWSYERGGGGGVTRVIADGAVFEKGGVNLSAVEGPLSDKIAGRLQVEPQDFFATGISLVLHPASPRVPTVHMNLRYLEMLGKLRQGQRRAWFGGGADMTPYYLREDDAVHFHRTFKAALDRHDAELYPRFKLWCDEYFHLPHRGEARGIGGIFFDYLDVDAERTFAMVRDVGEAFLPAYVPVVERRAGEAWSEAERRWQLQRRGRYVEFNLVHDRGTLFGLETGGRTESILMSLPPLVRWDYAATPEPDSEEARLLDVLRRPVDWARRDR